MKISRLFLPLAALMVMSGCQTPPPAQPLILTCEDLALKRKPYVPAECCWSVDQTVTVERAVRVDYGK